MPYIEGPKIDWTVNDGLYHRFLKWIMKCENILKHELAMLVERRKCKKVIAWIRDSGIDQSVSWNLTNEELTLDVIWETFEEFCKLQSNEVRARCDLLTSFRQGERSVDEWYNAVQMQVSLAKYPQETAKILHRDIFWFSWMMRNLFLKPSLIVILTSTSFLQVKWNNLPRKWKVPKLAKHIKQVVSDPQTAQIHLMCHQCTELPPSMSQRKQKKHYKSRQDTSKQHYHNKEKQRGPPVYKKYEAHERPDRCKKCGDSQHVEGFRYPASKYQCKIAISWSF